MKSIMKTAGMPIPSEAVIEAAEEYLLRTIGAGLPTGPVRLAGDTPAEFVAAVSAALQRRARQVADESTGAPH